MLIVVVIYVDITKKLNKLNLQLQGELIFDLNAFINNLRFWEQNLINHNSKNFSILSEKISHNPLELYNSKYHVEIISNLKDNFENRFKDFNEIALVAQFVVFPFIDNI